MILINLSLFLHFRCLKIAEISGDRNFRLGKGLLDDEGRDFVGVKMFWRRKPLLQR